MEDNNERAGLLEELRQLRIRVRELETAKLVAEQLTKRLRESEESHARLLAAVNAYRYQVIFENGIVISTKHSSGCIAVTGYRPQDYEADGHLWFAMVHYEDREQVLRGLSQVLSGEVVTPIEHRIIDAMGEVRWVRNTMVPYRDESGRVVRYDGVVENISDRKKAERELVEYRAHLQELVEERTRELEMSREQLRHSERLASVGTFAAGIAHEINNPVGGVLLAAQFALSAGKDNAEVQTRALHDIVVHAKRCRSIITNVLKFAREESREKACADLNSVAEHACALLREDLGKKGCGLQLLLSKEPALAMMNETEIEQVIVNLVRNSCEARAALVTVSSRIRKQTVQLLVEDNGAGIPKDKQQFVFDPFYTTRQDQGGSGLGLSITHGIVKGHKGTITIESTVGRGTSVVVTLPRADAGSQ